MTTRTLLTELRAILGTGLWEWDVRGPSHLPPGAWLRRLGITGTPLDTWEPTYIHPLLALSVYRGRFAADSEREAHVRMTGAQLTFAGALVYWSQALDITPQEAAKWFYVFTPPLCPVPREMLAVANLLVAKREVVFSALSLPLLPAYPSGDYPSACLRPKFWTEEVRKR